MKQLVDACWLVRGHSHPVNNSAVIVVTVSAGFLPTRFTAAVDGSISLDGLSGSVEIVRDANVPHIFAKTARDTYFALGLSRQDRLSGGDESPHYPRGWRKSWTGSLDQDKFLRQGATPRRYHQLDARKKNRLQCAAGVNAFWQRAPGHCREFHRGVTEPWTVGFNSLANHDGLDLSVTGWEIFQALRD